MAKMKERFLPPAASCSFTLCRFLIVLLRELFFAELVEAVEVGFAHCVVVKLNATMFQTDQTREKFLSELDVMDRHDEGEIILAADVDEEFDQAACSGWING